MKNKGHPYLLNYIDDLCYCELPSKIDTAYQCLLQLLQDLGLDISTKKLTPPSTKVVCLGILFDTEGETISIPEEKLQGIIATCRSWIGRTSCSKTELQSLLGSLLYISKCLRPARYFLNRLLQLLRNYTNSRHIVVTDEFHRDLAWFCVFLNLYNGVTMYDPRTFHKRIYLDACLIGFGGTFDSFVYTLPLPLPYHTCNIAYLEMLNVVVAFKIWVTFGLTIEFKFIVTIWWLWRSYSMVMPEIWDWQHVPETFGYSWQTLIFLWISFTFQVKRIILRI